MNTLKLSENIVKLRHKKKVTQEELAGFIGVTKASVSKWETRQSMPDIMLLPQLATYFNVTLDELLGYEPQLSKEQIQKIYEELSSDFTRLPLNEVMKKSEALAKQYYSCYPFLIQICVLWLNHFMLAEEQERQLQILNSASDLCNHIIENCQDIGVCNDAIVLEATFALQLGNAGNAVEALEEVIDPCRYSNQADSLLIQAYQMAGETEKAAAFTQISMYLHLLNLIDNAIQYLIINARCFEACEETIRRIDCVIDVYNVNTLQANSAAIFYYQAAAVYCMHQNEAEALKRLKQYVSRIRYLLAGNHLHLQGDAYFDRLSEWFKQLDLGGGPPRNEKLVMESALASLQNPVFSALEGNNEFQRIKNILANGDFGDE